MAPKNLVWLASYPKSGNTWFRVFLTNLLGTNQGPADINSMLSPTIGSSRRLFDRATGLSSSDLTPREIESLRPEVYRHASRQATGTVFLKIHDAFTLTAQAEPLVPSEISQGAIYFIRNPLDLVISLAHHGAQPIEQVIERSSRVDWSWFARTDCLCPQLEQKLLSWSEHVRSWVDQSRIPVCVLRYEDMKLRTDETFRRAVEFLNLKIDETRFRQALKFSDFSELQRQELAHGFEEKPPQAERFFRRGRLGEWREALTPPQVDCIIAHHGEMMRRFGYLDDQNRPAF